MRELLAGRVPRDGRSAVTARAALADRPERTAAFDRDLLDFATRANTGDPERPAAYRYEYLLATAGKASEALA